MIRAQREARRQELLALFGGAKQDVYRKLIAADKYLPPINSPAVTRDYLKGVEEGYYLHISKRDVKPFFTPIKCTRLTVYVLLKEASDLHLGFGPTNMPSKTWMINVLNVIRPDHDIFLPAQTKQQLLGLIGNRDADVIEHLRDSYLPLGQKQEEEITRTKQMVRDELELAIRQRLQAFKDNYPFVIINY